MNPTDHNNVITIDKTRQVVNDYLGSYYACQKDRAQTISPSYVALWQTMAVVSQAGGKRLRPYMLFLAYQAEGGNDLDAIVSAAAAQEMLNIALLIHDDIIDRDDVRHGVKNISGYYLELYENDVEDESTRRHYASSAALLGGDLLIAAAHSQMVASRVEPQLLVNAFRYFEQGIFNVTGGELVDTELSFRKTMHESALTVAMHKTASYSFVAPLAIGASLADSPRQRIELLESFGRALGIAFQLRDDDLGVFGDEAVTGKSASGDIREGKRTYMIDQFYLHADQEQQSQFQKVFGHASLSDDELATARQLIESSGARSANDAEALRQSNQAHEILDKLQYAPHYRQAFEALIDLCIHRRY